MRVFLPIVLVVSTLIAGQPPAKESIKECFVSFDLKPVFKIEGLHTEHPYATIGVEGRHFIWPESAPNYQSLQDGRTYRFEIVETCTVLPDAAGVRETWSPELYRVSIGASVIYDRSLCSVHKVPMKRAEVPIIYGMPSGSEAYGKALRTQSPNGGLVFGGCIVMPNRQTARCWLCDECQTARQNWKEPSR